MNDILDATTTEHVATFSAIVIERLDDSNFHIEHDEGVFTLEDEYDLPQWDPAYMGIMALIMRTVQLMGHATD